MIRSFKDKHLEQFYHTGKSRIIKSSLHKRILMKLDSMDAATCAEDLQNPLSNNLHKLQGEYVGYWAISVNGPWRLVFRIQDNDIYDVMLVQYH